MFFKTYGLLGQNARNLLYIKGFNDKASKILADSKTKTKNFLNAKNIKVPETILVISNYKDLENFDISVLTPPFVIKPNAGFGGKGIIVIDEKNAEDDFVTNEGEIITKKQLKEHFLNIVDGFFSLSGSRDKVVIEKKIELDPEIELLGTYGLPDIRVIVFNMIPIMAMLRIPTKESAGKANLHLGACGVGIDISSGKLTYISRYNKIVKTIPGIGDVRGTILPKWDEILNLVVSIQKVTNIGYLGCDVVLDKEEGPLPLEVNIRPGLGLQLANLTPLKDRLKKVEGIIVNSVEKGVRVGKDLFGGDVEERIKNISGKKVVGQREYITIIYNEKEYDYICDIKLAQQSNFIDKSFLVDVFKIEEDLLVDNEIKLEFKLFGELRKSKFIIKDLEGLNIILGKKSLKGFLIDPFKYKKGELPSIKNITNKGTEKNIAIKKNYEKQLIDIDKKLIDIDKKLLILKLIKPININEEKIKFIESGGDYTPKFKYKKLKIDIKTLKKELEKIDIPEIPLKEIYRAKKKEILIKLRLLEAFEEGNSEEFVYYSKELYGDIIGENLIYSQEILLEKNISNKKEEFLTFEEVGEFIKKFNHIYSIKILLKEDNISSRFMMKGDTLVMRRGSLIPKKEMRAIIAHEIEGHYLRKINGRKMDLSIFSHGTANYLPIEEGIAIYNQNRFLSSQIKKYFTIFEKYLIIDFALKNSFKKLKEKIIEVENGDLERSFNQILRLKRGFKDISDAGCFVKDVVYVNGLLEVEEFLNNGGSIKSLYMGKINIEDIYSIENCNIIKIKNKDVVIPFFH